MVAQFIQAQQCLAAERAFAVVLPEARRLIKLEARLADTLGRLAKQVQIAGVRGETLHLQCANGSVAARLRSQARAIVVAMQESGVTVTEIKVKVRADSVWQRPRIKAAVSPRGIQALRTFKECLPADDALSVALERLLRHQEGRLE
ncbi:MAG: DUF721 domain-containing protein [Betaproteobacteria bacterium]|jgi:hypothetical protein|nr:MAG: DUF721 domain-containing protein [Betaproteobacteria bacterium]